MFILFYAQGCVCIISGQVNLAFYEKLGMKSLIMYCQIVTICGGTFIVLVQEKVIGFNDVY